MRSRDRSLKTALLLLLLPAAAAAQNVPPRFAPRTLSTFATTKAQRLLRDRLPCLGCHELGGEGGRIGPSLSNVNARRPPAFIYAMIRDPQRTMPGTTMPLIPMDTGTTALIASYLVQRPATPEPAPFRVAAEYGAPAPQPPGDAADLYRRSCAPCHGLRGNGDGYNARYLPVPPTTHGSAAYLSSRSDDALFDAIAGGGYVMNRSPRMPAFGRTLDRMQIRGLVRHLRALCRCEGPAWSRDDR